MGLPAIDTHLATGLLDKTMQYHRLGFDKRLMTFNPDGRVGQGQARMEKFWSLVVRDKQLVLRIYGDDGLTAELTRDINNDIWRGRWMIHERMPLELALLE
jgi:hypothetical protein